MSTGLQRKWAYERKRLMPCCYLFMGGGSVAWLAPQANNSMVCHRIWSTAIFPHWWSWLWQWLVNLSSVGCCQPVEGERQKPVIFQHDKEMGAATACTLKSPSHTQSPTHTHAPKLNILQLSNQPDVNCYPEKRKSLLESGTEFFFPDKMSITKNNCYICWKELWLLPVLPVLSGWWSYDCYLFSLGGGLSLCHPQLSVI